jgi:5-formyltetrahydrofolate cyclo-ligase
VSSKQSLRLQFRQLRRQLLPAAEPGIQAAAANLAAQLKGDRVVGVYWPLGGEADLRGLVGQRLALPRVNEGHLTYRYWQPGDALSNDDTRIPAPQEGSDLDAAALALLLVPALALDQRGIRLGYGGGWFDRLRSDPLWGAVPALAVLPAGCLVEQLPSDSWDVPFQGWLDEHGVHWLQAV